MGFFEGLKNFLSLDLQERAIDSFVDHPGLTEQLLAVQGLQPRPWRAAGLREMMGVPAIFGAVNMIANLVGSMSMRAFRGQLEVPPDDRPRIIVRPDPFQIPREFYRGTAYNLASRGEAWWWVAARDIDGNPLSVLNVNPAEVNVYEDPRDLRYPVIEWRGKKMRSDDMRQLVYSREPGSLRGQGPLQMCGAALSVAVEAQEWAANFYAAGGYPNIWIKAAGSLSGGEDGYDEDGLSEVQRLKAEWISTAPNTPKITDESIEDIKQFDPNPQGAQMLEARAHQNIDVATMFNMDAALLNAATQSSGSLLYQNVGSAFEKFLRQCLRPNYLEPIEQTMSDLLTRNVVARFNTDSLTLADIKTRYEVYGLGIDKGIIDSEEARSFEGLAPGDVENAAVPFAPPQAIPTAFERRSEPEDLQVRCDGLTPKRRHGITRIEKCNRLLSETGAFAGQCPRCKKAYEAA